MFDIPCNPAQPAQDPAPTPAIDPDSKRRQDIRYEIVKHLRSKLPFTDAMSDADRARMLDAAISDVSALGPGNGLEARYAACQVACLAHLDLCTEQATQCLADVRLAGQLRAQAALMGREARGHLNALLKLQAARAKRDGPNAPPAPGVWAEPCSDSALRLAAARLPATPDPVPRPVLTQPALRRAASAYAPPIGVVPPPEPEPSEEEMARRRLEQRSNEYAVIYPLRTRMIRRMGGMPPDAPFEAPDPGLLAALLGGKHSNHLWADGMTPEEALIDGGQDRMGWPYEPDADPELVRAMLLKAGVNWRPGLAWNAQPEPIVEA